MNFIYKCLRTQGVCTKCGLLPHRKVHKSVATMNTEMTGTNWEQKFATLVDVVSKMQQSMLAMQTQINAAQTPVVEQTPVAPVNSDDDLGTESDDREANEPDKPEETNTNQQQTPVAEETPVNSEETNTDQQQTPVNSDDDGDTESEDEPDKPEETNTNQQQTPVAPVAPVAEQSSANTENREETNTIQQQNSDLADKRKVITAVAYPVADVNQRVGTKRKAGDQRVGTKRKAGDFKRSKNAQSVPQDTCLPNLDEKTCKRIKKVFRTLIETMETKKGDVNKKLRSALDAKKGQNISNEFLLTLKFNLGRQEVIEGVISTLKAKQALDGPSEKPMDIS